MARNPARLPRIRLGLDRGPTCSQDTLTEGPARVFRPLPARSTLAAPRTITGPVRNGGLPLRWTSRLVPPCGVSLVARAKMPRISFYNRRSRHEHPSETPLPETARRAPWETHRRSTSRPPFRLGFRLSRSSGAGPPCGHPTSDGCALDGAFAGFGPVDKPCSHDERAQGRGRPGFFGRRCLRRFEPSDTSHRRLDRDSRFRGSNCRTSRALFQSHDPGSAGARQCAGFHEIEVPSVE
jgi:hypothetical protein